MKLIAIKKTPVSANNYQNYLRGLCEKNGHDFMLRFSITGPFYECFCCKERRPFSSIKVTAQTLQQEEHEFVRCNTVDGDYYKCAECGMVVSEQSMKEACLET